MKKYDLVVRVGTYFTKDGVEKGRWETIGAMIEGKDGRPFITLKRTFNPAGIDVETGKDSIIVSLFEPKDDNGKGQRGREEDF